MVEGLSLSLEMVAVLIIITLAITAYATEWIAIELTSLLVLGALLVLFYLFPVLDANGANLLDARTLLSGFADPALITILALLVLGQGLFQTGALDGPAQTLVRMTKGRPRLILTMTLIVVMLISAVLNNTPVVVMFIPIVSALADKLGQSTSKVMMPLSFIAVLGGMMTLIGSSTNLLVAGAASHLDLPPIGFFDFIVPGGVLATVGGLYVLFILPRLLTDRAVDTDEIAGDGKQFIAQIEVTTGHPLVGKSTVAGMFKALPDITVRMIQRREKPILPPFDDVEIRPGDLIVVAATRKALEAVLSSNPDMLGDVVQDAAAINPVFGADDDEDNERRQEQIIAEAVIAPASRMIGRSIEMLGLRYQTGTIALGIQRRSRMYRTNMNDIRLEAGDVLLLLGKRANIRRLRADKDLLLMEWSASTLPNRDLAWRAMAIFGAVVGASATGLLPIVISALLGVGAMILFGCLNIRQAARAIDRQIFLLVASALAMGSALQHTQGAAFVAQELLLVFGGFNPAVILSVFFLLVAIMTNILSNNATAVLFTPIGASLAYAIGVDPFVFIFAVIFAANCSFATPMAYQTNLLVMGPGHHTFMDYVKGGTPLIILLWLTYSLFAPWYYGLI